MARKTLARQTLTKLPAAAALAVVLAAASACGGDGGGNKDLAKWAAKVCTKEVTGKIDESRVALNDIAVVVPNENPDVLKGRLVADFGKLADANTAFAAALERAGDPGAKPAREQAAAVAAELRANAGGWTTVKGQLEAVPSTDQRAFADGLRTLEPSIRGSVASSQAALAKLHTGDVGRALGKVPGCVGTPAPPPPPAPAPSSPAPPPPAPEPASSSPAPASPSATESASPSPSASGSPSGSASPTRSSSASRSASATATRT